MEREAMTQLVDWKNSHRRMPLIVQGARQVGKTRLMKEFGMRYYEDVFYFSFHDNNDLSAIFDKDKVARRLVDELGLLVGKKILPGKHLIIIDEIQENANALGSLKSFCEDANEYHVMTAGSLLGTLLSQPMSYPVGKVNLVDIYPMNFDEFTAAVDNPAYNLMTRAISEGKPSEVFHSALSKLYDYYLIIGGMPACVNSWVENKDPAEVERVQHEIVKIYENDFAKHNKKVDAGRILMVFRSIVGQLAKENKKFVYGCIKDGARAREFEIAIEWLVSSGIVIRVYNVSKPEHPLNAFEQFNHFKLFLIDVGLLKYMAGVSNEAILLKSDYQFKGALTENYVLQQIRELFDVAPKFFSPSPASEID
ncbi:MAG: ATP-binding protein, partial [Oscillospiraceae bacterium]|nr:ATP-binding protein [Oscillospiraceae bacterium]